LRVDDASGLKPCDVVLATDCVGAAIFQMTALGGQGSCQTAANGQQRLQAGQISHEAGVGRPGNASINLGRSYVGGELLPLATRTYYVRVNTAGRPGLWQRVADQNAQELVEGVEELQVVYGMDRDGDGQADEYRRADAVAATGAWGLVVSVRLGLLLVGDAPVLSPDARIYEVNGESVTTSDRRLRQVFTTTVALRNRLP
jgi:type IV pilus assembly protein PilW